MTAVTQVPLCDEIDPDKLDMLADWFSMDDTRMGRRNSEVQEDLRRWAHLVRGERLWNLSPGAAPPVTAGREQEIRAAERERVGVSAPAVREAAQAREVLESAIWRHLPPGTVYAAGRTDILLAAADAYAARGSAQARRALGEMWWHLSPQPLHAGAEEVLLAADMYAAASVAAVLGALESPSLQSARRDELMRAAGRRGRLELVASQAGGAVAAAGYAWAQCPCGREYDITDSEGKRRCSECRRRQAREAMTRYRARKRAGQLREAA